MIDSVWAFVLRRIVAVAVGAAFYAVSPTGPVLGLAVAFVIGSLILDWFLSRRRRRSDPSDQHGDPPANYDAP